ncbi:MAG: prolipoprotein diacylglyceryl transferase [Candidatus Riflebacteria bacterium]|nr:prolipoprotein diacylglyceryl transferase [Candidatus Riflebacteria bacterium]
MYPIFFSTPWFNVYAYGTMMAIGYTFGTILILREVSREGIDAESIFDMLLLQMVVGVAGARILYLLEYSDPTTGSVPGFFDFERGGLTFYGAVISSILFDLVFLKFKRIPFWRVMDVVGPVGIPIGVIFGRIGCFLNGCCYGVACSYPWGVVFPRVSEHPLHPVQLYEVFAGLLLFFGLRSLRHRRRSYGQLFVGSLMGYAAIRFLLEFWRGDNPPFLAGMTLAQVIGLVLIAGGIVTLRIFDRLPELRVPVGVARS